MDVTEQSQILQGTMYLSRLEGPRGILPLLKTTTVVPR
jgi:hypothetical protein